MGSGSFLSNNYLLFFVVLAGLLTSNLNPSLLVAPSDNFINIPVAEIHKNTDLYPNDVFIRTFYYGHHHYVLHKAMSIIPFDLYVFSFVAGIIVRLLYILGFFFAGRELTKSNIGGFIAGISALVTPGAYGSSTIQHFVSANLVYSIYPWFAYFLLRRNTKHRLIIISILLFVLLTIHPFVAFPLVLLSFAKFVREDEWRIRGIIFGSIATIMIVTIIFMSPAVFSVDQINVMNEKFSDISTSAGSAPLKVFTGGILIGLFITCAGVICSFYNKNSQIFGVWIFLMFSYYTASLLLLLITQKFLVMVAVRVFVFVTAFFPIYVSILTIQFWKQSKRLAILFTVFILSVSFFHTGLPGNFEKRFLLSDTYQFVCKQVPSMNELLKCNVKEGPLNLLKKQAYLELCPVIAKTPNNELTLSPPGMAVFLRVCTKRGTVISDKDHGAAWYSDLAAKSYLNYFERIEDAYKNNNTQELFILANETKATNIISEYPINDSTTNWRLLVNNSFYYVYTNLKKNNTIVK